MCLSVLRGEIKVMLPKISISITGFQASQMCVCEWDLNVAKWEGLHTIKVYILSMSHILLTISCDIPD